MRNLKFYTSLPLNKYAESLNFGHFSPSRTSIFLIHPISRIPKVKRSICLFAKRENVLLVLRKWDISHHLHFTSSSHKINQSKCDVVTEMKDYDKRLRQRKSHCGEIVCLFRGQSSECEHINLRARIPFALVR